MKVTGVTRDGGHQEYLIADKSAVVHLPESLHMKDAELAPLLCAGNTVYEALKKSGMQAGDTILIQGLGGLGHLAIQVARKAGCKVVVVSGSPDKKELALELGAHYYFSAQDDVSERYLDSCDIANVLPQLAKEMQKIGSAKIALATAPSGDAPQALIPVLDRYGTLAIVGTPNDGKELGVNTLSLITKALNVRGLTCGSASDNDSFCEWCDLFGVKSMVKEWPLEQAFEAVSIILHVFILSMDLTSFAVRRHHERQAKIPQCNSHAIEYLFPISVICKWFNRSCIQISKKRVRGT